MSAKATGLVPMAGVADVQRSIDFYAQFGLALRGNHHAPDGTLVWAFIKCHGAELMLSRAENPPVPAQQSILLYLYSPDLIALREQLIAHGVTVSEITYPFYMEKGEMCLSDPDGYTLLIGQIME